MKVLVTGAGGFLGKAISQKLLDSGKQVVGFARGNYPDLEQLGVEMIKGDLTNYQDIEAACKGCDAVIHTASKVGMWGSYQSFYDINVRGTENLIQALKKNGIKTLIYTSTPSVVFGDKDIKNGDEQLPYPAKSYSPYAATKAQAEKSVLNSNGQLLQTTALRPHLIFGPGDQNLLPTIFEQAQMGKLKIIGDGNNLVDVTYIDNAADAHLLALEQLYHQGARARCAGEAYFIGQGPINLWDFINQCLKHKNIPPLTSKIPLSMAYIIGAAFENYYRLIKKQERPPMTRFVAMQLGMHHYFNHSKAEDELGFTPQVSVAEGIILTCTQ